MSDKVETEGKPKKGKGLIGKLLIGVVLLGAGGGGAFGMMQAGMIGGGEHAKVDNNPRLVRKGETDPYAPKSEGDKEGSALAEIHGDGGSEYQTSYYSFSEDFTSNLKNSDALLQVALAASTHRDGRVLMWMKKHELAIRSRMLEVLADTPEEDVYTLEGKDKLQKRMTAAINKVLTDNEGFGGVDAVYFRNFIIQ
jgi:flagellar FliL protein